VRDVAVTFLVCSYNQERFVEHAVRAALSQDYCSVEVLLSDDCSVDRTFEVMERLAAEYRGPHRIILNRNPRNLGIGAHLNRMMDLATGQLIVASAGDDISLPHRTSRIVSEWKLRGCKPDSIYSMVKRMSPEGVDLGVDAFRSHDRWDDREFVVRHGGCVLGAGHAWTRRMWDAFGPMSPTVVNEDWVLPLRASLMGGVCRIDEPLVRYRVGVSTWHHKGALGRSGAARRQRLRHYFDLAVQTSAQALTDVRLVGDSALVSAAQARLREAEMMREVCRNPWISPQALAGDMRKGVSMQRVAAAAARAWLPMADWLLTNARRTARR
jgi:hypothetical protein